MIVAFILLKLCKTQEMTQEMTRLHGKCIILINKRGHDSGFIGCVQKKNKPGAQLHIPGNKSQHACKVL